MSYNRTSLPESAGMKPYVIVYAFFTGFIAVFGTLANGTVILTYIKWRRTMFETPRDILIFTLAFQDFITSVFVTPFGLASSVVGEWTSDRAGCVWYAFVSTWMGLASILQLTGIAAERFFSLRHPDLRWSCFCKRYTPVFIAVSFLVSGITSTLPLLGWSKFDLEGVGLHCSIVWNSSSLNNASYCLFLLVFFFTIPLFLIMYFYTNVYFIVRRLSSEAEAIWGVDHMATRQSYLAQVRVSRQLVILTGMFILAWTPYALMSVLSVTNLVDSNKRAKSLPALFAKMSYVYNPLVYFFTFKRLRKRSIEMLVKTSIALFDIPKRFASSTW